MCQFVEAFFLRIILSVSGPISNMLALFRVNAFLSRRGLPQRRFT